jgi:sulfiredoxin
MCRRDVGWFVLEPDSPTRASRVSASLAAKTSTAGFAFRAHSALRDMKHNGIENQSLSSVLPTSEAESSVPVRWIQAMMRREKFAIANIYVPVKRRATLKPETVQEIARSILEIGQQSPILVRRDGDRFVLVHGLHRLEACKALGEETIDGYLVQAEKH